MAQRRFLQTTGPTQGPAAELHVDLPLPAAEYENAVDLKIKI